MKNLDNDWKINLLKLRSALLDFPVFYIWKFSWIQLTRLVYKINHKKMWLVHFNGTLTFFFDKFENTYNEVSKIIGTKMCNLKLNWGKFHQKIRKILTSRCSSTLEKIKFWKLDNFVFKSVDLNSLFLGLLNDISLTFVFWWFCHKIVLKWVLFSILIL